MLTLDYVRRCRWFFIAVRGVSSLFFEAGMTLLSFYAAKIFLCDPDYFARHPHTYAWFITHVTRYPVVIGILALAAAALKAIGMICLFAKSERAVEAAFVLRQLGWALSFVFWGILSVALFAGNPESLGAGAMGMLSIFALGVMLAGPVMPESTVHNG